MIIVDAHEDLAWNALTFGRDYMRSVAETRAAEAGGAAPQINGETLIGWPEWIRGDVAIVFGTLFAAPERHRKAHWDANCYADAEQAHALYQAQLDYYLRLEEQHPDRVRIVRTQADLQGCLETWSHPNPSPLVGLVLLMEGADGIREPGEVEAWYEQGVRAIGPAWSGTRYAGGTMEPGPFTDLGRALMDAMAPLGLILDISHLSDDGVVEALERYDGPLIASHANPRRRLPHHLKAERHLSDEAMRGIAARDGVMGTLLGNGFLYDGWERGMDRGRVTLDDVAACIDYVCQVVGDADHIGLGSDFDGGFGLDQVPEGLDSVADLRFIGDALARRGYTDDQIAGIMGGNWLRILSQALPE